MNRKDFGKLVAVLRKEKVGIDGNQMTQKELAALCEIDDQRLGQIERGTAEHFDAGELLALAEALNLSSFERRAFFANSVGIESESWAKVSDYPVTPLEEMYRILKGIPSPALLVDCFCDVIAANSAYLALFGLGQEVLPRPPARTRAHINILRFSFSPEFQRVWDIMGDRYQTYATDNLRLFRALTFGVRAHPDYVKLLKSLAKTCPNFRQAWNWSLFGNKDYAMETLRFSLPLLENDIMIDFLLSSIIGITVHGELRLLILTPMNSPSTKTPFGKATEVYDLLPNWPNKEGNRFLT